MQAKEDFRRQFYSNLKAIQQNAWEDSFQFREVKNQKGETLTLRQFRFSDDKLMISYYGEIGVGPSKEEAQLFKVLFDTGSTDLFLAEESCDTDSCVNHSKYHKTSSYQSIDDTPHMIEYISGHL